MDLQLSGKCALVSGADRGTGAVIAQALMEEGVRVLQHGFTRDSAVEAAADEAQAVWGDITTEPGCAELLVQIAPLGPVDILVNNYGTADRGRWRDTAEGDWLRLYQQNVLSAVRLSQALIGDMKEQGWGRVVNLGTIGSHQPNAVMPHYYAAKGALATLGPSLALELTGTGVTVNTVSPGLIHTPELEAGYRVKAQRKGWGGEWPDILRKVVDEDFPNPCQRIATRREVADLVVFLCSPRADFINGQNIRIDGGAVRYV